MLTHWAISQQGEHHKERGTPCQDFSMSKRIYIDSFDRDFVVAAIADGVGSCSESQRGSRVAVSAFMRCAEHNLQGAKRLLEKDVLSLLHFCFRYALRQVQKTADRLKLPFIEFDSTLTGAIYDGSTLWFGHVGDDGCVALCEDGNYAMVTKRHSGEEAHSLYPLRESGMWQFDRVHNVSSFVLMTDGVLDYCVDSSDRIYFPFLEPALTDVVESDADADAARADWDEYFSGGGSYAQRFRDSVTDDITFVCVQNSDIVKTLPDIFFDVDRWTEETARRKSERDKALYAKYREYKKQRAKSSENWDPGAPQRSFDSDADEKLIVLEDTLKAAFEEGHSIGNALRGKISDLLIPSGRIVPPDEQTEIDAVEVPLPEEGRDYST